MSSLFNIGGLASGLDTNSIIDQLMALERIPVTKMKSKQTDISQQRIAWTKLETLAKSIGEKAAGLSSLARLYAPVTSSSNPDAVAVSGSLPAGTSLAFKVTSLATASQSAVTGFSSASQVTGAGTVTVGTGLSPLGLAKVSGAGATAGAHTVAVTAASSAATLTSTAGAAGWTTTGGQLRVTVDGGAAVTVNVAAGTYTATQLADTLNTQLGGTGAKASVVNGQMVLGTTDEGSAATIAVAGGPVANSLGLGGQTATGTDAVLTVDGAAVTVTDARAGATVTAGGLTLTLAGGLRTGTSTATIATVSAGATVTDVANAVNSSGAAAATVVNTGDPALGTEILFTATATGTAGAVTVSLDGFAAGYTTNTVRTAADAVIQMGAQTITRSSNTVTDLVDGATITLKATTAEDVTITSARDDTAVAGKVKEFVGAINAFLVDMKAYTKYDPAGDADGPLSGDGRLRSFNLDLMRNVTNAYGDGPVSVLSQVGIRVQRDGTLSFDEATFAKAMADNPDGVADVLSRSGTAASSQLAFTGATAATLAGSYDVVVTSAATMAGLTSAAFTTLAAAEDFTFTVGTTTKTYSAAAGATGADVAAGLNAFFSANSLKLLAEHDGTGLVVRSTSYGSAATFTASSTAGTLSGSAAGTDVAGTINGVAATGSGQVLTGATGDPSAGLGVKVTATAADLAAAGGSLALGALVFNDGVGGVLDALVGTARNAGGMFRAAFDSLDAADKGLRANIEAYERRLEQRETTMRSRFSAMELAMSRLQRSTPDFSSLPRYDYRD